MKIEIIKVFIPLSFFVLGSLYSQDRQVEEVRNHYPQIEYISETGDYKISYMQDNGEYYTQIFIPSTKIDPRIECLVVFNADSQYYHYQYKVYNNVQSKQRIVLVAIDYFSNINSVSRILEKNIGCWLPLTGGIYNSVWWINSKDILATPYDGIAPDSSQDGFEFKSSGLPQIVNSYFSGNGTSCLAFPEEPPEDVEMLIDEFSKTNIEFPANTVQRKTLGPKDPPSPFVPTAFLDTLVSYTRQSKNLGWITDQAAAEKYEGYFTMAQNMLQQNRITETRAKLQEVLRDVEADSGAFLTSEAYALLRYNTEYLLSQLPESEVTLEDLIAYIRKAQTERKIDNVGIANSLISKLEEAKKQLEKEKSKQTVNALNGFLNELSRQHQKHIADEVYGYLKEKVERLISQIESSG